MDIHIGLRAEILDLVDPWFEFPIFEDGRRVTGRRVQGHGRSEETARQTREGRGVFYHHTPACAGRILPR